MKTEKQIKAKIAKHQKLRNQIGKRVDNGSEVCRDCVVDDQLEGAIRALNWVLG